MAVSLGGSGLNDVAGCVAGLTHCTAGRGDGLVEVLELLDLVEVLAEVNGGKQKPFRPDNCIDVR